MTQFNHMTTVEELACSIATGAILEGARLPGRVFKKGWNSFAFFPSDILFDADFESIAKEIMRIESAKLICLLNIGAVDRNSSRELARVCIKNGGCDGEYFSAISAGGPECAWIYNVDRYVCASDIGSWCIQCDRENDIAVIAFRENVGCSNVEQVVAKLGAKRIKWIIEHKDESEFPFNSLTDEWMAALMRHYGQ